MHKPQHRNTKTMSKQGSMGPSKGFSTTESRASKIVKVLDARYIMEYFPARQKKSIIAFAKKKMEIDIIMVN